MSGNQSQFSQNILDALQIFANAAWHNPSAFRRTHHSSTSRDVEYLHWQEHSIALRYVFGTTLAGYNKILVRDEYRQALQALQADSVYKQGMYIIGQPGIGKTSFLIYTLIERLREHKPVAVQLRAGDSFYAFFAHGTCTLYSLSDPTPLVQDDVWALSDPRTSTTTPLDIFQDFSAKVIQATSPGIKYWERWSEYCGAQMFVMDIWSEEEIADLSSLLELNVERMTALAAKWGGVPRALLQKCKNNESQQDWDLRRAVSRAVENHATFLPALHALDGQDVGTSAIFFVLPLKDRTGNIYRRRYIVCVPTATLQNALAIALQQMQNQARIDFFLLMSVHPGTRSCARNIYANWILSLITLGRSIYCNWSEYNSRLSSALDIRAKQIPVIRDAAKVIDPPCYWIAPRGEFPGIDFALVTTSGIFAIQVVISFHPSSPQIGLDRLQEILPVRWKPNSKVPWGFLFVGISRELIDNALKCCADRLTIGTTKNQTVYVGSCVVNSIDAGISYKAYTYDGEDAMEVDYEEV